MIDRIFSFFSSLRLTVVLLALALLLVFIGTLAQVKLGLYAAQSEYFRSFIVWWKPSGGGFKLPVYPGGWLLGTLLLINLIAAHIKRFQFTKKKAGIFMVHAGLILLLLGQFLTECFQVESMMRLREGETKNYAEDSRHYELAIIDLSFNAESNQVVAIPETIVAKKGEIRHAALPFTVRVKNYFENSGPAGPMEKVSDPIRATEGVGKRLSFVKKARATAMDEEDLPSALVEIVTDKGSLGEWAVSTWLTKYPANENLFQNAGAMLGGELEKPQTFTANGHTYQIELRPIRYYKPYTLSLADFTHEIYKGTDIPKNFSSKVHLHDPSRGEERDVLIYMNNPLRHAGETFYQSGFMPDDSGTILQVVSNPAAITPYISCALVGLGLLTQFLMHLIGFARKNKNKTQGSSPNASREKVAAKNESAAALVAERKAT